MALGGTSRERKQIKSFKTLSVERIAAFPSLLRNFRDLTFAACKTFLFTVCEVWQRAYYFTGSLFACHVPDTQYLIFVNNSTRLHAVFFVLMNLQDAKCHCE